jgi:hypothetical protein
MHLLERVARGGAVTHAQQRLALAIERVRRLVARRILRATSSNRRTAAEKFPCLK